MQALAWNKLTADEMRKMDMQRIQQHSEDVRRMHMDVRSYAAGKRLVQHAVEVSMQSRGWEHDT